MDYIDSQHPTPVPPDPEAPERRGRLGRAIRQIAVPPSPWQIAADAGFFAVALAGLLLFRWVPADLHWVAVLLETTALVGFGALLATSVGYYTVGVWWRRR